MEGRNGVQIANIEFLHSDVKILILISFNKYISRHRTFHLPRKFPPAPCRSNLSPAEGTTDLICVTLS